MEVHLRTGVYNTHGLFPFFYYQIINGRFWVPTVPYTSDLQIPKYNQVTWTVNWRCKGGFPVTLGDFFSTVTCRYSRRMDRRDYYTRSRSADQRAMADRPIYSRSHSTDRAGSSQLRSGRSAPPSPALIRLARLASDPKRLLPSGSLPLRFFFPIRIPSHL